MKMNFGFMNTALLVALAFAASVVMGCDGEDTASDLESSLNGALPEGGGTAELGGTPALEGGGEFAGSEIATQEGGEALREEGGEVAGEEGGETAREGGEVAGEEGGEVAGEEGGEVAGEEGGEATEGGGPTKEDCVNGVDDDADGLVDCQDPECATKPTCSEADCGNGADDDDNGLVDCDDPQCEFTDACTVESCSTFYLCLAEKGCDCEIGVDCTFTVGDDNYGQCQTTCFQNETCSGQCISELSLPVQEQLSAYNDCTATFCANATTDAEYSECIFESCVNEYVSCFYTGEDNCNDFYGCLQTQNCDANTLSDEQYSECVGPCYDSVSAEGFKDAIAWDGCRFDLCNLDGDQQADSTECLTISSYFACFEESGTCLDSAAFVGEGSCSDVANCVTECEDFTTEIAVEGGTVTCPLVCLDQLNPATSVELGALFTCGITACGSTTEALTPLCLVDAFATTCAAEFAACN